MSANIISNFIDIAPNEYFTKYSFNRNFSKLISNDIALYDSTILHSDDTNTVSMLSSAQTYNSRKTYQAGECVFYKIQYDDTKFYILSSSVDENTHKPMVRKNQKTGELYVINSEYWKILGIPSDEKESKPKDEADVQINVDLADFKTDHENNVSLSAHPTKKLGLKESSKTFLTLENITDDRQNLFYPNVIQSFVTDNTTYSGYMRKWDNGLLEYDVVFRLGYISSDAEGCSLISANNLVVPNANKNFMYFKDDKDYEIFNQGGENYIVTETTKQVNLNKQLNAYSGKINFIEPFKDLNYMVFTSGSKVIETEAYNMKSDPISNYDPRLIIDNRTIIGVQPDSRFKLSCNIPYDVLNIGYEALANIEMVDDEPVKFKFDLKNSQLINISQRAFMNTDLFEISIPASTKYVGKQAFDGCNNMSCVNIYLSTQEDSNKQIYIGENAFTENVSQINVIYLSAQEEGSSQNDLYAKLLDSNYRNLIGLTTNSQYITISAVNRYKPVVKSPIPMMMKMQVTSTISSNENNELSIEETQTEPIISIDVNDFIYQLQHPLKATKTAKRSLLKATRPLAQYDQVFLGGSTLTGCDTSFIYEDFGIDFTISATSPSVILGTSISNIISISNNALKGLNKLTGLTSTTDLTSIEYNGLPMSINDLQLNIASDKSYTFDLRNYDIDRLTIKFDGNPTSLSINANATSIGTLNLFGNGYSKLSSNTLSINRVDQLVLSGFSHLSSSSFGSISSIYTAILYSSNTTTVENNLFNYETDNDRTYATVYNVDLRNDAWSLCANSFQYMQIPYLSIDMKHTTIGANAFNNAQINQLMLSNATSSNFNTNNSFLADSINYVRIPDQIFEIPVVRTLLSINYDEFSQYGSASITIDNKTISTTSPSYFIYIGNNGLNIKPYYISVDNNSNIYSLYEVSASGTESPYNIECLSSPIMLFTDKSTTQYAAISNYPPTGNHELRSISYDGHIYNSISTNIMYELSVYPNGATGDYCWLYPATLMKNAGFKNQTMFTIGDETKVLSIDSSNEAIYNDRPTYLGYTNDHHVSSFNPDIWKNLNINKIDIPYGISAIDNGVFSSSNVSEKCISAIQFISIPKTVKSIGENAFNGLSNTNYISFEPGIDLTSIGNASFDNCSQLNEFIIRK